MLPVSANKKKRYSTHTASFPATKAPDTAVIPTRTLIGSANFRILAAPFTQLNDSVGGSGMTTERAVHKRPLYITNADVR